MFKVKNTPEPSQGRCSDVFIVNFEHILSFSEISIVDFEQLNVN